MKVYVVTNGDIYALEIIGVFSTREKAQKYIDDGYPHLYGSEIEEWDVQ